MTPQPRWVGLRRLGAVWALTWRGGPGIALGQLVASVLGGVIPACVVLLTKSVVDELSAGRSAPALYAAGLLAVAGFVTGVLPNLVAYLDSEQERRLDVALQSRLHEAVNSFQGISRFESPPFLDRLRMAAQASGTSLRPITSGTFGLGQSVITLVTMTAALLALSMPLTGVVLLAALPALVTSLSLSRRSMMTAHELTPAMRRQFFYSQLITDADAAKEVRLFGLGDFLKHRLLEWLGQVHAGNRRLDRRTMLMQSSLAVFSSGVAGAGLVWAVREASRGHLSIGDVTALAGAVAAVQGALRSLVVGIAGAYEALLIMGYHASVTDLPDDLAPPEAGGHRRVRDLRQGIEFRDVWFRYGDEGPWALKGVDLFIPKGKAMALVGMNGSGKSTLVKLLCRFYDPSQGVILWDGVDLRDIAPVDLRRKLGVLFQDFMSYDLSAAENIGIGYLDAAHDRGRIEDAARLAFVHDDLRNLPRGYDTLLSRIFSTEGEKDDADQGVLLSGGQWQRVALARAFMRDDRDLLILDEPNAGLDARAEHQIHERLRRLRANCTSLLITHRLGTVRDADEIVVLADGRVIEKGTHAELMENGASYAELFWLQASGYDASPASPAWAHGEPT